MKGQTTRWLATKIRVNNSKYTLQPSTKILNKFSCLKRHEISIFTAAVCRDLIFLQFEACFLMKVT